MAGTGAVGYAGDGARASAALLTKPQSVAVDGEGNVFIGDYAANVAKRTLALTQMPAVRPAGGIPRNFNALVPQ